jgi:peptide/nickel transport system permease protein
MNLLAKLIVIFWIFSLFFNYLMDVDPNYIEPALILSPPDIGNWFGRDDYGRPIFFRLVEGFHNSIEIIFFVTIFTSVIGITLGVLAGYFGGKFDGFISFIINFFMSFPGILLAIAFAAMLPAGKLNLIIALSVGGWVGYARLARGQTLLIKNYDFINAAESMGCSHSWKIIRHILPALRTPLIVEGTYAIAGLIIAEASLSFLGLGIPAPDASWGAMMRDSVSYLLVSPHYSILVGVSIMSLVYCINFIGDYLHKYWDIKES